MKTYRYQVTFTGRVSPQDDMGTEMGIEAVGPLGPGCDPLFGAPGSPVRLGVLVSNDEDGAFTVQGEVTLPGGTLTLGSDPAPALRDLPDPRLQSGTLTARIEDGSGALSGATGSVFMHFTVDEDAVFIDLQSGLVFLG
ncbi:MAG: hypothetical protein RLN89_02855 [Parvibaculum sp.]